MILSFFLLDFLDPFVGKIQFSLIRELFVLFISSPSFDLFAPHIKVLASRISAVTSLPLFLSSFLAERGTPGFLFLFFIYPNFYDEAKRIYDASDFDCPG